VSAVGDYLEYVSFEMAQFAQSFGSVKTDSLPVGQVLLLVDCDAESIRLVRKAFRLNPLVTRLIVVKTPDEAMDVLRQQGRHSRDPKISMVLLEMNLPTGFQAAEDFIKAAKGDRALEAIPVVAMGAENSEAEVSRIYSARANCFIERPQDPLRFQELIMTTCQFWLAVANWSAHSNVGVGAG
jgi:CheY-like chemotaxis protein